MSDIKKNLINNQVQLPNHQVLLILLLYQPKTFSDQT